MIRLLKKAIGGKVDSKVYNEIYRDTEKYKEHYKKSMYYPVWQRIVAILKNLSDPHILEIGCGTGQLAHYLYDEGFKNYRGFDISEEAIRIAKSKSSQRFYVGNVYDKANYVKDYSLVIATEVFEHLAEDIGIINNLKKGTKLIFSIPTFYCKGHLRWFRSGMAIRNYYFDCLNLKRIMNFRCWFLCLGVVK